MKLVPPLHLLRMSGVKELYFQCPMYPHGVAFRLIEHVDNFNFDTAVEFLLSCLSNRHAHEIVI
jgi:hypothetical protein